MLWWVWESETDLPSEVILERRLKVGDLNIAGVGLVTAAGHGGGSVHPDRFRIQHDQYVLGCTQLDLFK